MQQHPNSRRLIALMDTHQVSPSDIAEMTGRSYKTVLQWRSSKTQIIPDVMLEFLELKLGSRQSENVQ